jgi:hypothetical protein
MCRDGTPELIGLDSGLSRCVRAIELRGRLTLAPEEGEVAGG